MDHDTDFPSQDTLIGILGDPLPNSSVQIVYTTRIPLTLWSLPDDASETVREARSYLCGTECPLVCSYDHEVVRVIDRLFANKTQEFVPADSGLHFSIAIANHEKNTAILLGGIDTRILINTDPLMSEKIFGGNLKEFLRKFQDRPAYPVLRSEDLERILAEDAYAFEKALGVKPA